MNRSEFQSERLIGSSGLVNKKVAHIRETVSLARAVNNFKRLVPVFLQSSASIE